MDRQNAAARLRRGWVGTCLLVLGGVVAQPAMAACNSSNPHAKVDPTSQTVPDFTNGTPTVVTLNGSTSTPTNGQLVYAWQYLGSTPSGLAVTLSNTASATPTFRAPDVAASGASLQFRLTVICGPNTDTTTTTVNVTNVVLNQPPVASATATPSSATEGTTVTLDGTASFDPDGTAITYNWTQIGTPTVTLSKNGAGSIATFVAPDVSNTAGAALTFRLTVSDGTLTGSTDKIVNILWTNDPPVARLDCPAGGIINVNEGGAVAIDGSASSDPDGTITYSWSQYAGLPNLGIGSVTTPKLTFTAPHLGYQQLGGVTLRLTVTDNNGAASTADCSVFIHDVTAPVLTLPANITAEATSAAGKAVSFSATAQDAVDDGAPYTANCAPASGSIFGLAAAPTKAKTTAVNCSATDSAGNTSNGSFNVTVQDTTAPVITAPGGVGVEATSASGAVATFSATTADAVDGAGNATCAPASGSTFTLGGTLVTCNASDARGNAATPATFTVNVLDTAAPTIDAMSDVGPIDATSAAGAVATYTSPATHDVVDGAGTASCAPPSGGTFAIGSTTVTCTASDAAHNAATPVIFKVLVHDASPPVIDAHAKVGPVEATGPDGAAVHYDLPATHDAVDGAGTATCVPPSGSTFALGTTSVQCSASDHAGNAATGTSFDVDVVDTTAPVIASHADLTVEATGPTGAPVGYTSPTTSDIVDGAGEAICTPASGTTFALGTATVTCHAADHAGNQADATSFHVTVQDTTPPVIDAASNLGPVEATGPAGASVNFTVPATHDIVDGDGLASCDAAPHDTFAIGTTAVHCDATDAHGNHATQVAFTVTVVDTTPPTIASHDDAGPIEATSAGGASVDYTVPATTDIVDGAGTATCAPASGSQFKLGATTVDCNATDAHGNHAKPTSFVVRVHDTTPPAIAAHGDVTAEATGPLGALVTYSAPTTTDAVDGNGLASCAPASGSQFALGSTEVTCNAVDVAGNTSTPTHFNVLVRDTTPPIIDAHAAITDVEATGPSGAPVTYTAPATHDIVDGNGSATCLPASGATFALGKTSVHCAASDHAGNAADETTFDVTVIDSTPPLIAAHANVGPVEATGPSGALVDYGSVATSDLVDGAGTATCMPATNTTFGLGDTTVTCHATDAHHNAAEATTFKVTVRDSTPPTIDTTADIGNVEATGPSGASVTFTVPATHDVVDGDGLATCDANSGDTFPLGATTVHCNASDHAGNAAHATFKVTVVDTTAPSIAAHADIGPVEATGPSGASVGYVAPATSDLVDGTGTATCAPASGTTFALGDTAVTCNASDAHHNAAVPTGFTVKVRDTTPPVIAAHGNVTAEATGPSGAAVTYTRPGWTDAVSGSGLAVCLPASGSTFALGSTTVTCGASDGAGNAATQTTFQVVVQDTTPPVLTYHADVTSTATGNSSANVSYASPTASDLVDGNVAVTCTPASGTAFNVGATTVNCSATDAHHNTGRGSFKVNVNYTFAGFFRPVDNLPIVNVVKAGSAVPVKFSLGGNQGLAIFAANSPSSVPMTCNGALQDAVEETVTAGGSSLSYDATAGQYIYVWKTDKAWGGSCRQLQVKFADGSVQVANFNFTR